MPKFSGLILVMAIPMTAFAQQTPESSSVAASGQSTASSAAVAASAPNMKRRFSVGLAGGFVRGKRDYEGDSLPAAALHGGVLVVPQVGVNGFMGTFKGLTNRSRLFLGTEAEFIPVVVSVLGWRDGFSPSLLLGASTIRTADEDLVRPQFHTGLKASFHVGDRWSIYSGARVNPTLLPTYSRWVAGFTLVDLGMIVRL